MEEAQKKFERVNSKIDVVAGRYKEVEKNVVDLQRKKEVGTLFFIYIYTTTAYYITVFVDEDDGN